jgi:SAM-dependent methyltransferase
MTLSHPVNQAAALDSVFRCPGCGASLDLARPLSRGRCESCGLTLQVDGGIYDFVLEPGRDAERRHYDGDYRDARRTAPVRLDDLERAWLDPARPIHAAILQAVGSCRDKVVLVLGNGDATRELWFLTHAPRLLVLSDLSVEAMRTVARNVVLDGASDRLALAAIDALNLPIQDGSVDVVYGMAFVHHLPDVDSFLAEVARVLRPGGRAVFRDDGHAPAWQKAKTTWLRPLMRLSHRLEPRSPEDLRHTMEGGFEEANLAKTIESVGGRPFFDRRDLVVYLWQRAVEALSAGRLKSLRNHRVIVPRLAALDSRLRRFRWVRRNQMHLIWGFDKPLS